MKQNKAINVGFMSDKWSPKVITEQRRPMSDIYSNPEDMSTAAPERMTYRYPLDKFIHLIKVVVKDIAGDELRGAIMKDLDNVLENGLYNAVSPIGWDVETGVKDIDSSYAVELFTEFYGDQVLHQIDPQLNELLEAEEPFTLHLDNSDGDDATIESEKIRF